jgi:putative molybdopterin biosynthesis protein
LAAAKALKLEFIPVASERYDLLVLKSFAGSSAYRALIKVLSDPEYRSEVEALGGYDLSRSGDEVPLGGN